jgi:hypothetical protein
VTPIRSCVGCGERAPQAELLRVVLEGGDLRLDRGRRSPGRGAYLHARTACWTRFASRRGVVRSLRATPSRAAREALAATLAGGRAE